MAETEVAQLSATQLRHYIATGRLSPVEVVEACLAQIEHFNPQVNAICTLSDRALEEARACEAKLAQAPDLPLLGIPVGIKDVTPTAGLRTTYGSVPYADHVPQQDALIVQRLRAAGAVILGKTNTPEFAAGANTFNDVFGATRNPWNLDRTAGGSTGGGAAALATGMIALAEGTDLGGSLRIPASFCGVVGLRPSVGLVPLYPSDFFWDTLQVTGPMARTAGDVALMLQAIAGASLKAPFPPPWTGRDLVAAVADQPLGALRLGYSPDVAGIGVDSEVESICCRAAKEMRQEGVSVEEVEIELGFARFAFVQLRGLWMVVHHRRRLDRLDSLGENLAGNIRAGLQVTPLDLAEAEAQRARACLRMANFFRRFDLLLTPCMAVRPFPVGENYPTTVANRTMETYVDWIAPTFVFSLTGLPAVSVPCGRDRDGLPVGLQLVGPPQREELVLALADKIQRAFPIGRPPLMAGPA